MIAIGCDHGGWKLKNRIVAHLQEKAVACEDFGTFSEESVDYPVYALKVAEEVAQKHADFGILVCSTGLGICMAANKVKGIRSATCTNVFMAEMTRRHNDANVLCLGGLVVEEETALAMVDVFLKTEFEGGRHQRRVDQITKIESEAAL